MIKTYSMDLYGRKLEVEIGKYAELANAEAMVKYGNTYVLMTAVASKTPRAGIDFFPLSVDYMEKFYSIGKFPGGYRKREGRPSDDAILASRLIDRPIRPLFPEDYRNDVSVTATVLSVDQDCSPELTAMIGSSIVLAISDIPFNGPTGSTMLGYVDGKFVVNPKQEERSKSTLELTVASVKDKVIMIEAGANELPENLMVEAIEKAHNVNKEVIEFINKIVSELGKPKHEFDRIVVPEDIYEIVKNFIGYDKMEETLLASTIEERGEKFHKVEEQLKEHLTSLNEEYVNYMEMAITKFEEEVLRTMVLTKGKRVDGRGPKDIRQLSAEVDILPVVHGSGLFKRGQTQVLNIATLGSMADAQEIDGLDTSMTVKRYVHHYNFTPFSTGEAKPNRGPGRREIGHGALAEKALVPVLPSEEDFPYAIRLVSEVLSSNGSTSQASTCASTLSLMAAGVPIKAPVAGISVGLITGKTDDEFVTITDIQGVEDHLGDMDFKVAGTHEGITAIQLDMKVEGITMEVVAAAIKQAKEARTYILDEIILKAIPEPRKELAPTVPKILSIRINPEKIGEVIGPKGKMIDKIIAETGVKIDIEDDGKVFICGLDLEMVNKAISIIKGIAMEPQIGEVYTGKITKIMPFGAFMEIAPGKEGLVHISKLAHERLEKVEDMFKEGDIISAKLIDIDSQHRINLSRKAILPEPEKKTE